MNFVLPMQSAAEDRCLKIGRVPKLQVTLITRMTKIDRLKTGDAKSKVYFVLGCTACGKSTLGRELARRVGGQIISVDSMKIYRRMDIGTAKPSIEQRSEIPHHCIDLVEPSDSFSVAKYLTHADRAIEQIIASGAIRLAVGGTSLYIKALCEGLFEGPACDPEFRDALQTRAHREGLSSLHDELGRFDPEAAARIHPNDQRRIFRAMEVYHAAGTPISKLQQQWDTGEQRYDCVRIGIRRDRDDLHRRINRRARRMIEAGLKDEAASLLAEPRGLSDQAAQSLGYPEMIEHLQNRCTLDEALERIKINTRRLAKKQRTWLRRWSDVQWFDVEPDESVESLGERVLARITFN